MLVAHTFEEKSLSDVIRHELRCARTIFSVDTQTVGGHRYRTRSVGHVIEEMAYAKKAFPEVKEFFFDDDTFTDDLPRAEAIAREFGKLGVTWSCDAKANVPRATLEGDGHSLRLQPVPLCEGGDRPAHC